MIHTMSWRPCGSDIKKYIRRGIYPYPQIIAMYAMTPTANGLVQISVVFNICLVNVHIHRNLLLDNKRAITGLRGCVYSKPTAKYILFCMKLPNITQL